MRPTLKRITIIDGDDPVKYTPGDPDRFAIVLRLFVGPSFGEFKGFTKSPTEHIINRYERLVKMRSFAGTVVDPSGAPVGGVVVEVRGPGRRETITGAVTDSKGQFRIGHLRKGRYTFKVTFNGFQSVVGELRIDPSAVENLRPRLALKAGV